MRWDLVYSPTSSPPAINWAVVLLLMFMAPFISIWDRAPAVQPELHPKLLTASINCNYLLQKGQIPAGVDVVLADTPPKEAFAAVAAGCPVVFASRSVATDGAEGADAVGEQVGVCRFSCDGLCGQRTGTVTPLCDGNQDELTASFFYSAKCAWTQPHTAHAHALCVASKASRLMVMLFPTSAESDSVALLLVLVFPFASVNRFQAAQPNTLVRT